MSYLPLQTVQFFASEFEKRLSMYSLKVYKHDEFLRVYSLNDSLLIMVELYGTKAEPCLNAEEIYGKDRSNPFLEFPIRGEKYYTLHIAELTPNNIGFKYNNAKFVREMQDITNICLLDLYILYAKYGSEKTDWWNPNGLEGSKLADRINSIFPELHLHERILNWEGDVYNFIVIEFEDCHGIIQRAVAYTKQQPQIYMLHLCDDWISTGKMHGNGIIDGRIEKSINAAFSSWKGIKSLERLEQHLQYFCISKKLKNKFDAYSITRELYSDSNSGKYQHLTRSRYIKPKHKWVSEELVYRLTKKLYKDYVVIYQHRPFFLRSSNGGQMSYDIFISKLNIAIEYQGQQHFEPVDFFGGEMAFEELKKRDAEKAVLSAQNGVKLVYINYWEEISPQLIIYRVGIPTEI